MHDISHSEIVWKSRSENIRAVHEFYILHNLAAQGAATQTLLGNKPEGLALTLAHAARGVEGSAQGGGSAGRSWSAMRRSTGAFCI